jgi:hypothetical protein
MTPQNLLSLALDDTFEYIEKSLSWCPRPPCGKGYPHICEADGFHCDISVHSRRWKWLEARKRWREEHEPNLSGSAK